MDRRTFIKAAGSCCMAGAAMQITPSLAAASGPELGDNGLYRQPFLGESFLNMADDHADAAAANKNFAILWEQRGCPYCRELHHVNFARKPIRDYIDANFSIVQLDLWGARETTDFDGKVMEERALARRWAVNFTPTMIFFPREPGQAKGKDGQRAEIFRMPGYFKPFHFLTMLEFVHNGAYRTVNFQRYLQNKFTEYRKAGKKIDVW